MSLIYFNANEFPYSDANKKATDKLIIVYGQSQPMRDSQQIFVLCLGAGDFN